MSIMQQIKPLAVVISDLHWSKRAPLMHSQSQWLSTLENYANQLKEAVKKCEADVIVCAGDVFDHWDEPAEVINHYLKHMPHLYSVAGNHEMPNHRYELLSKSIYWTAVQAGAITHLDATAGPVSVPYKNKKSLDLYGFSWLQKITKPIEKENSISLAVLHAYIWSNGTNSNPATAEKRTHCLRYVKELKEYDAAIFGDNHRGFSMKNILGKEKRGTLYNCGGFMRRKWDEVEYSPSYGYLYEDGSIIRQEFNTEADRLNDKQQASSQIIGGVMSDFLDELTSITEDDDIDFDQLVREKVKVMKNRRLSDLILSYLDGVR